jgi:hypothetical protein
LTSGLKEELHQLHILNLLVLNLGTLNRAVLKLVLKLLNDIGANASANRMTIQNVATVMAPTMFPAQSPVHCVDVRSSKSKSRKNGENAKLASQFNSAQIERTMNSCTVTKMLIHHHRLLFNVSQTAKQMQQTINKFCASQIPPYILRQVGVQSFRV